MTDRLADVSHTNPYTGESFGRTQVYDRGKTVAADGGEHEAAEGTTDAHQETLEDVDHTPPDDALSTQSVYDRYASDDE